MPTAFHFPNILTKSLVLLKGKNENSTTKGSAKPLQIYGKKISISENETL